MTTYEIPLRTGHQSMSIRLGDETYQLRLLYADAVNGGWVLDISDASGVALISGLPLVAGADLLAQHKHLGIAGALYAATEGDVGTPPDFESLGRAGKLYFVS